MKIKKKFILNIFLLLLLSWHPKLYALSFYPTDFEWSNWPEYCRAKYVVSGAGRHSDRANNVPRATVRKWENQLQPTWGSMHHYCASKAILFRASQAIDSKQKMHLLKGSLPDALYTYKAIKQQWPLHAEISTHIALIFYKMKDYDKASKQLEQTIRQHPKYINAYTLLSLVQKSNGDIDNAIITLKKGNKLAKGKSGEIHYFLGLMFFEKELYDKAKEQAIKADNNNYHLIGLKRKLIRIKKW